MMIDSNKFVWIIERLRNQELNKAANAYDDKDEYTARGAADAYTQVLQIITEQEQTQ
jgi:hypothetical protein